MDNITPAQRFAAPSLKDARLIIGVLIVLLGAILAVVIVRQFDASQTVWRAQKNLHPGQAVTAADFTQSHIRFDEEAPHYFTGETPPHGVVQRYIYSGEILPRTAIGRENTNLQALSLQVEAPSVQGLRPGQRVDMWFTQNAPQANGTKAEVKIPQAQPIQNPSSAKYVNSAVSARSRPIATGVLVTNIHRKDAQFSVQQTATIQVMVAPQHIASLLDAQHSEGVLSAIPVAGGN